MPSNVALNDGTGSVKATTKQVTHDGDTSHTQMVGLFGVTGTEDSYTIEDINGSAANGLEVDVTRVQGTVTVDLGANNDVTLATLPDTAAGDLAALVAGQLADGHNVTIDNAAGAAAVNIQDGGNSITVDGTVSVSGTVTVGSHAVTNVGTFAVQVDGDALTSLQTIDDPVLAIDAVATGGSVMMAGALRDDSLSALTPAEGDAVPLRVNSTGALHVTGGGGGTQYNIDDVLGATDTVTLAGVVRDDSLTTLTEADGDVSVLRVNSTGALHVTGGGGGTEYTEDVATADPIVGTATMMERDDALSTVTPIEGDWIGLRGSAEGALWVQDFNSDAILSDTTAILADTAAMDTNLATLAGAVTGTEMQVDIVTSALPTGAATAANQLPDGHNVTIDNASGASAVNIQDGGNSITVDGTVTANLSATDNAVLDTIDAVLDTINAKLVSGTVIGDVNLGATDNAVLDNIQTAVELIDNAISGSEMQVDVVAALPAGSNLVGDVGISGARTSGGTTFFHSDDLDETEEQIKGTAGQLYWLHVMNLTASVLYLQVFNATSASVTVGTTAPDLVFPIPTQGSTDGAGFNFAVPNGIAFGTAITVAATTTATGGTGPAANSVFINAGYA